MVSDRSNGINRGVIIALVGLILIGAGEPPKSPIQTQDSQAAAEIKQAGNSISSAIIQAAKPAEKDGGCQDRKDRRDSDLCAQWKAADAATNAAEYACWTLWISAFGTCLLVWTLWETRRASRREFRAYIRIDPAEKPMVFYEVGKPIVLYITITNYGRTPAFEGEFLHNLSIKAADHVFESSPRASGVQRYTMHPSQLRKAQIIRAEPLKKSEHEAIGKNELAIHARSVFFYRDAFGSRRKTMFSAVIDRAGIENGICLISETGNTAT
jgi:hypothetical protein